MARSVLVLDTGRSIGRAHEIAYDDARRVIAYRRQPDAGGTAKTAAAAGAAALPAGAAPPPVMAVARGTAAAATTVQLDGPDGDLTAERIEIVLAKEGSGVDRLEAYNSVSIKMPPRTASGARLTFHAADKRYVMSGAPGVAVKIVDGTRVAACSETTGDTLTFYKGDRYDDHRRRRVHAHADEERRDVRGPAAPSDAEWPTLRTQTADQVLRRPHRRPRRQHRRRRRRDRRPARRRTAPARPRRST